MIERRKKVFGYTLIELVLVVGILAILSIIAVSRFSKLAYEAKITAAKHDMITIKKAFESPEKSYFTDLKTIPGFSPAYIRVTNLFIPTNIFGSIVLSGNKYSLKSRAIRLDYGTETLSQCEKEHRAMPHIFTTWNPETKRGWNGPYISSLTSAPFPHKDDRRFPEDATFESRNFFPDLSNLRLPRDFKNPERASIYGFPGEPTLFDPWGNPYVIQVPPAQAFSSVTNIQDETRFFYARIVSAGPNGILESPCFSANRTNMFSTTWNERTRRLSRQAGRIDGDDISGRGDDIVLFFERNDIDEGCEL
ncbi:MAG: prepilin-type N-terminal cleavage/methylation domain-containing protein [Kiritimatiellae bacterium]|nr:prepilin-type N-terminal cleavage/methylation domain-containing protein [Kiritimatiellia bacterium]